MTGRWVLEEKETVRHEVPLREWWAKVSIEAARRGRHPAIVLTLKKIGEAESFPVAVVPYSVFLSLLKPVQ